MPVKLPQAIFRHCYPGRQIETPSATTLPRCRRPRYTPEGDWRRRRRKRKVYSKLTQFTRTPRVTTLPRCRRLVPPRYTGGGGKFIQN
jgi:hypothetical protein